MIRQTQKIRRQQLANCLSVFDHFVGLALKGLRQIKRGVQNEPITRNGVLPATTLFL